MKYSRLTFKAAADGETAENTAKWAGATLLQQEAGRQTPVAQVPVWIWGFGH